MAPCVTMKDLINAIAEHTTSEAELIATVVYMVNSGRVRLRGRLAGARFDMKSLPMRARAAA